MDKKKAIRNRIKIKYMIFLGIITLNNIKLIIFIYI